MTPLEIKLLAIVFLGLQFGIFMLGYYLGCIGTMNYLRKAAAAAKEAHRVATLHEIGKKF